MSTLIDISLPLHNQTITWPGEDISIETPAPNYAKDGVTVSQLHLGTHTGTHIDAPRHFFPEGGTLEQIQLEKFIGPCQVITIKKSTPEITLDDFDHKLIIPHSRILFKTKNSLLYESGQFTEGYTALSLQTAQFLVEKDIWLVGIDYLSIEKRGNPGHPVHKALLQNNIVIVEGLYLDHVTPGEYKLVCLPLNLYNTDGSPCRAILKSK